MPVFAVLGGTGMMGRVAVRDLFESNPKNEILIVGSNIEKAKEHASGYKSQRVKAAATDVTKIGQAAKILKNCDVALNCVQYYYNLHVMKAALEAGVHYLDLGGLFHMTRRQLKLDKEFKKAGLSAVLGMGSTPGITNVLAAHGADFFSEINSIDIKVGERDFSKYSPAPPLIPYSLATLKDEFTKKPAVYKNGKLKFVKPLSGRINVNFPAPIKRLSAIYTLHSELATFPKSFGDKGIKNASFRVAFGNEFVKSVMKLKERDVKAAKKPKLVKLEDYECLRVEIRGKSQGRKKTMFADCVAKAHPKWKLPAGDVDTGTPISIVAQMIANGKVSKSGAFAPEYHVPSGSFFKELEKRYMKTTFTIMGK